VCERQPELGGLFTGECQHLGNLLGRELRLRPRPITVAKNIDDKVLQVRVGNRFQLRRVQEVRSLGKTLSPTTNALPINPELHALLGRDVAVVGRDDDLGALDDPVL